MKKALFFALVLVVAGAFGVAQARADSNASVSVWAEAGEIGGGATAPTSGSRTTSPAARPRRGTDGRSSLRSWATPARAMRARGGTPARPRRWTRRAGSSRPAQVPRSTSGTRPTRTGAATPTWKDEAGGSGVASITYDTGSGPQTVDGDSASVRVGAEGTTTVTYYATDAAGNAEKPHTLTVRIDETAPTISASDVTADATSADGATVTYDASASDNLDPSPSLTCDPASGSTFPIGKTTVTCTATDQAGNTATATFTVTVRGAADQIADELSSAGGLGAKQQAALADVQAGRINAACGVLGAYANQVRALAGKKLPADEATQLLATVQRIKTLLGC